MEKIGDILLVIWSYFAKNILTQPAFLIGLIVFVGYVLLKRPLYESISGFLKATVGYLILTVGSGGLVNNFRPILVGLKDRFQLHAMVTDPYFGQNAVTEGIEKTFGRTFGDTMLLLLIAFIFNILLVRFRKYTKLRAVFTTGNVQVQQAATAFWLLLFCFPQLGRIEVLLVMGLILGCYWAVGSNLTVDICQDLTEGAGFAVAHQQMFGIYLFAKLSERFKKNKSNKRLEDIELPGFLSMFNENMVATSILMLLFFGIILLVLGQDYLLKAGFMQPGQSFLFYILQTSLMFAVYLAILQLGVRTFVAELTDSFNGISNTLLPGAVPGIDIAATFAFGSSNAVTVGFLFGALGQFVMIMLLILLKSPTIVVAGFIPLFFDNAAIAVFSNNRGGIKAAMIFPFISGLIQVGGSALIASWVGLAQFGGYIGMFDWATVWPGITVAMKFLGFIGVALVVVLLLAIPQLQYRADPKGYFLIVDDYDAYLEYKAQKA
ncbi:PTS ascorbate transporter subunit IIC [Enterococcus cecorum]|uniref:Ascorbate-specific PTS system EIIC component n=3 Tax=Enterococcus cecorum TaxID=44008 RepID=S1QYW0_9ENTE|nr:PTS ascorbate transporter subunit IIC [Enterococcus cecorum]HLQ88294.1 PTS ascorbate transporter subunit IIC [Enterococcus sp.]EOX18906.1 PTS system ascorbate-specific transporter subunit IIC [Enterococcus cecorum DSM 20682 = ATCC 43198]ESK61365.1 PTS system ascorbate-specific transporter subunit IIC [Enterococcus cecorum DSM 20682 = ATCC 43198]KLO74251.1 PTS system ascorbate-specific transporter subunit IIC [Enterococcus cecorum]MCJ0552457.1 PTS ascorbate transporter subunit IIC [Enterococ